MSYLLINTIFLLLLIECQDVPLDTYSANVFRCNIQQEIFLFIKFKLNSFNVLYIYDCITYDDRDSGDSLNGPKDVRPYKQRTISVKSVYTGYLGIPKLYNEKCDAVFPVEEKKRLCFFF